MSRLYLAWPAKGRSGPFAGTTGNEPIVIKVVEGELAMSEGIRKRHLLEGLVSASVKSPHVVRVLDIGELDNVLYLAMEFLSGGRSQGAHRSGSFGA